MRRIGFTKLAMTNSKEENDKGKIGGGGPGRVDGFFFLLFFSSFIDGGTFLAILQPESSPMLREDRRGGQGAGLMREGGKGHK